MSRSSRIQCRQFEVQSADLGLLDDVLGWFRDHNACRLAWAFHPAEGDKPRHFHAVAKFDSTVDCQALRALCMERDRHSHSDKVSRWPNMVRYLRHLDKPGKAAIPPEDCHYEGFPENELDDATRDNGGALSLVAMVADMPHGTSPVDALRICVQAGFRPSEVSGVSRALFDLSNLLTDDRRTGIVRSGRQKAPSAPPSVPPVILDPILTDPAFFASPDELDATIPQLDN